VNANEKKRKTACMSPTTPGNDDGVVYVVAAGRGDLCA